jgi:hypothetical protein
MSTLAFLMALERSLLEVSDAEWLGRCCAWMNGLHGLHACQPANFSATWLR